MMALLPFVLYAAGIFGVVLGGLHFFFPLLFDFRGAIPTKGESLKPFPLVVTRYQTTRQDIYGLVWVMNNAASFAILSVGVIDLVAGAWLASPYRDLIAAWIAAFYLVRAASQLFMGRRRGDWLVLGAFTILALVHLLVILF
jgi:hypothetical protein